MQGGGHRNSHSAEFPIRPVGRGEEPAAPGREDHRRPVLRCRREEGPLRALPPESLRQKLRLVLYRMVRGQLVRGESGQGGDHLHEGADETRGGGTPDHGGFDVESK